MKPDFSAGDILSVEAVEASFDEYMRQPHISPELYQQLSQANLLIVPLDVDGEHTTEGPVFSNHTQDLFDYLHENAPSALVPEVCAEEEQFREIDLRSALEIIGAFFVAQAVAPITINLLSSYLYDRFKKREVPVELELTVISPDGSAKRILYKGPAAEFETRIAPTIEQIMAQQEGTQTPAIEDAHASLAAPVPGTAAQQDAPQVLTVGQGNG